MDEETQGYVDMQVAIAVATLTTQINELSSRIDALENPAAPEEPADNAE